jgi:L-threonylcarbamoyladenylate synthase
MSTEGFHHGGGAAGEVAAADAAGVARAVDILRHGGLVAFPTETVYGLGADATNDRAVAAIFEAKGRPRFNPLIVHIGDVEQAAGCVAMDERARAAAERFWPGPLTLVLPRARNTEVSYLCSAGLDSLAVRIPAHPIARDLLGAAGRPLAAPSANPSGGVSPTTAAHVADGLGDRVDLILDGGRCAVGLESSVLDLTAATPVLLRPGGIPKEDLEAALGPITADDGADQAPRSPGRLASHYAPGRPLRLDAREVATGEALLAFGPSPPAGARTTLNLSPRGDLVEAAANLFAMLHALDDPHHAVIAVMPIPDRGLGAAINDRLRRAAAPRA